MAAETILLLDDDPTTINVLREVLQQKGGFVVLAADSVGEALELCQQHRSVIAVLICDVMLRQLGRQEITTQMRQQRPEMRLLLISGYAVEDLVERGLVEPSDLASEAVFFLQKPFMPQTLVDTVRSIIAK